jgi:hypothetical protein
VQVTSQLRLRDPVAYSEDLPGINRQKLHRRSVGRYCCLMIMTLVKVVVVAVLLLVTKEDEDDAHGDDGLQIIATMSR